jgi:uncharacterized OsmC-like protein
MSNTTTGRRETTVELWHEKTPAADGASMIDHFHRTIHLDGDLTEEQRLRLLQIAEKCPVSETLRHAAIVDATLAGILPEADGGFAQSVARS